MRGPGQRGRWPVRNSYPPGGGCGFLARTPTHPASTLRPAFRPVTKAITGFCTWAGPPTSCAARTAIFSARAHINFPRTQMVRPPRTARCARLEPTPAAGRIALAIWPPSTLARLPHLASEGTRASDTRAASATTGLAKRGQRERCRALVRIVMRKHRSAQPRAFRPPNLSVTTGRAAEVRVTSCEIKGAVSTGQCNGSLVCTARARIQWQRWGVMG